jgi:hypothetical protein
VAKKGEAAGAVQLSETVGTLTAFGADGAVLWSQVGFAAGRDRVPRGVGMAMRAMLLVDAKSGEVLRRWDPWRVL